MNKNKMSPTKALLLALIVLFVPLAYAEEVSMPESDDSVGPDSIFYGINTFFQKTRLLFMADNHQKLDLQLRYSEQRLNHLHIFHERGKDKHDERLLEDYEYFLKKAEKTSERTQYEAGREFIERASMHQDILFELEVEKEENNELFTRSRLRSEETMISILGNLEKSPGLVNELRYTFLTNEHVLNRTSYIDEEISRLTDYISKLDSETAIRQEEVERVIDRIRDRTGRVIHLFEDRKDDDESLGEELED